MWRTADKAKAESRLRSAEVFKTLARLQKDRNSALERMRETVQRYLNTEALGDGERARVSARVVRPAARPLINSFWYARAGTTLNMCGRDKKNIQPLISFELYQTCTSTSSTQSHVIYGSYTLPARYTIVPNAGRSFRMGDVVKSFALQMAHNGTLTRERAPCLIKAVSSTS